MSIVNQAQAKAEAIMMGMTQPVEKEEVEIVLDTILKMFKATGLNSRLTVEEIIKDALQYSPDKEIAYIGCSVLMCEFRVINLVLKSKKAKTVKMTKADGSSTSNGVLAYCCNLDNPDLSELGYMFFERTLKGLKRIA